MHRGIERTTVMRTVAVVLCNYNHAKYLPDSLGHICRETRRADQIVVINDGSTDDSWDIIQAFARDHSNLEAHANGRNLGLEASIAKALQMVRCDYLVWAAADDRLLPPFLECNMAVLANHPAAALSFSEVVALKGDSGEIDRFATNPAASRIFDLSDLPVFLSPAQLRKRMTLAYLPLASNTAVIRLDALRELGGFPAALRWFADSFACTALAMRHGACVICGAACAHPLAPRELFPDHARRAATGRGLGCDHGVAGAPGVARHSRLHEGLSVEPDGVRPIDPQKCSPSGRGIGICSLPMLAGRCTNTPQASGQAAFLADL
jgi:hypothetical protein